MLFYRRIGHRAVNRNIRHAHQLTVFVGLLTHLQPFRIGVKSIPGFFARRKRIEGYEVGKIRHIGSDDRTAVEHWMDSAAGEDLGFWSGESLMQRSENSSAGGAIDTQLEVAAASSSIG